MSPQKKTEMHIDFWDRERELGLLSEEFERRRTLRLVVIYGRRCIGKGNAQQGCFLDRLKELL